MARALLLVKNWIGQPDVEAWEMEELEDAEWVDEGMWVEAVYLIVCVDVPYYFQQKPQWLSAVATRLSDVATWSSHSATAACVKNNTVDRCYVPTHHIVHHYQAHVHEMSRDSGGTSAKSLGPRDM
jgi:hypothetical protein